jgi:hypothetical protein
MRTFVIVLAGALLGAIVLFLVGAIVGGNFATDFELAGLRGYEAAGVLGILVGLVTGGGAAAFVCRR